MKALLASVDMTLTFVSVYQKLRTYDARIFLDKVDRNLLWRILGRTFHSNNVSETSIALLMFTGNGPFMHSELSQAQALISSWAC